MNVLVTGASGFIGRALTAEFVLADHHVAAVDRGDGDLRRVGVAAELLDRHSPEVVVHLAARVGRENCDLDHGDVIATNAGATLNMAQACADAGVRLVYVSSSEAEWNGNLYGLTKRWGEEVAQLYDPDAQILRLFMPYGPGHPPGQGRAALTNFLWDAMNGRPLTVHRDTARPWTWIGDTVAGMRMVIEDGSPGFWNVGRSDNVVSTCEVARQAILLTNSASRIVEVDAPGNVLPRKQPDTARLLGLGWRPTVDLADGMARTLRWLETRVQVAA